MYSRYLCFAVFVCQIILNESSVINEDRDTVGDATSVNNLPSGYVTFPDVHAAYKVHESTTRSWYDARDKCIAEGAYLAIVDSIAKIKYINSLKIYKYADKWLHIGIHSENDNDQWIRVDNDLPVTSIPWTSNSPDGSGNCAGMSFTKEGIVDYQCNTSGEYYVCEITV